MKCELSSYFFRAHCPHFISNFHDDNSYFTMVGVMDEKYLQNRSVNMTLIDHKSKMKMKGKKKREIFFRMKKKDYVLIF